MNTKDIKIILSILKEIEEKQKQNEKEFYDIWKEFEEWREKYNKYHRDEFDNYKKQIQKELLSDMLEICDKTENEGARLMIEYFRKFIK